MSVRNPAVAAVGPGNDHSPVANGLVGLVSIGVVSVRLADMLLWFEQSSANGGFLKALKTNQYFGPSKTYKGCFRRDRVR